MAQKFLYRSKNDRMITGVLGGLGEYFNIDPIWLRLGFVAIGGYMLGNSGIAMTAFLMVGSYIAATFIIPEKTTNRSNSNSSAKKRTTAKKK